MNKTLLIFTALIFTCLAAAMPSQAMDLSLNTIDKNSQHAEIQKVNINHAKANDFSRLKGIGQKKAQAIIHYRELNGAYNSLDDLLKVKGIGKKILLENKAFLTI